MEHRPLQPPGAKRNTYSRPGDRWVCGRTGEGCAACPLGPDPKGRCQAVGECLPVRQGARWECTRGQGNGGKCSEGPRPDGTCCRTLETCTPKLSLRARRGRTAAALAAGTLGALLFFLSSPRHREAALSPGHLSSAHSAGTMHCADCHDPAAVDFKVAFDGPDALHQRAMADGKKCLSCHALGPAPFSAHGVFSLENKARADTKMSAADPVAKAARWLGLPPKSGAQLACQTCHSEHRGLKADLKAMSDSQCQSCHQAPFASFTHGHPEFGSYPRLRPAEIQFDHVRHLRTHFADPVFRKLAPADCAGCHEPSKDGRKMLARGFDASCASCHGGQVAGEGRADDPGIAVWRVPGLDRRSLQAAGLEIGEWPEFAEGKLTPFMEVMLGARPDLAAALQTLRGTDWLNLEKADRAHLEAAALVAWGVKTLFFRLTIEGQEAFLTQTAGPSPTRTQASLVGGLPLDTLQAAQQLWFPHLEADLAARRAGVNPTSAPPLPSLALPAVTATGSAPPGAKAPPGAGADDDLLGDSPTPARPAAAGSPPVSRPSGDDLLAADNLLLEPAKPALVATPVKPVTSPSAEDDLLADLPKNTVGGPSKPASVVTPQPVQRPPPETWTRFGGWYRQDATFTLHYRPAGHGDPFLRAWIEHAGMQRADKNGVPDANRSLFTQLTAAKAPGLCAKCHAVEAPVGGGAVMHWRSHRDDSAQRGHTIFAHRPHLALTGELSCQTCHALDESAAKASVAGQTKFDPITSNFRPLAKDTCASCHRPGAVSDGCTSCHTYHAGTAEIRSRPRSEFRVPAKAP